MEGRYLERQHDVEAVDKPFEFFMNRFRLLEAAPRKEFALYTGLPETVIRPHIDEALAQGISRNVRNTGRSPSTANCS